MNSALALTVLAACASAQSPPPIAPAPVKPPLALRPTPIPADRPDDPPVRKWIPIDWSTVHIASDADAIALWHRIAPTGDDWEVKLGEVPGPIAHELAIALLHEGNFTCVQPSPIGQACPIAPIDIADPTPTATIADPCLRRWLAIWALAQVDDTDLPAIRDSLQALVALPAPESELIAAAFHAVPADDQDLHLELLGIAAASGHSDVASSMLEGLDVPHLTVAATKLHIDGAVEMLSAEATRAVYLGAVADSKLHSITRISALRDLVELDDANNKAKPLPDLQRVLVATTKDADCDLAAAAADALRQHGDMRFVPARPHTRSPAVMMRQLCVLASWDRLPPGDQHPLESWLPPQGVDESIVTYDPNNTIDADGDGDPHFERVTDRIAADLFQLPDLDQMIAAFAHCTGTSCKTEGREFRFGFKPGRGGELMLAAIDSIDRPPCDKAAIPKP